MCVRNVGETLWPLVAVIGWDDTIAQGEGETGVCVCVGGGGGREMCSVHVRVCVGVCVWCVYLCKCSSGVVYNISQFKRDIKYEN